jgi:hypothetical protein
MALIDRVGRFRGRPTQGIMDETKNGFPNFIVRLEITEMWDVDTKMWVDWSSFDMSITGYLVLFNATKALMNYDQVMKAFNWDGTDMSVLQTDDYGDLIVQFEVEENIYDGKTSLRVNWIDNTDANPEAGRGGDLTPSDAGKIKTMNARYKQFMKVVPKIAPATAPIALPPLPVATPVGRQGPPLPVVGEVIPPVEVDQIGAWAKLNEGANGANSEAIGLSWLAAIKAVTKADGTAEPKFTNLQWTNVLTIGLETLQQTV